MKQSHDVLKHAIDRVGMKTVASALRLSYPLIAKWCQDSAIAPGGYTARGVLNPLDRVKRLYDVTHDRELISWICQAAGGFYVSNVDAKPVVGSDVVFHTQRLIKEFAETLAVLSKSFEDDHRITPTEATAIRKEWEELKQIGEALVGACEAGRFNQARHNKEASRS